MLIWRAARLQCPSRSGDPQRGDRWQKSWVGARGGFEELLRKSRPRLAPPVRATPRRGSAPDQSDPALVESRGIGRRSGDPERDGDAARRLDQRIAEQHIPALRCVRTSLMLPAGEIPAPERGHEPPHRKSSLGSTEVTTWTKRRQERRAGRNISEAGQPREDRKPQADRVVVAGRQNEVTAKARGPETAAG